MEKQIEIYYIRNKSMADAIKYILRESYFVVDDKKRPGRYLFGFSNTPRFQEAFATVSALVIQNRQKKEMEGTV